MAGLSNPTVIINDQVVAIKPDSLTFKLGRGDMKQRSQSAGGSSIQIVSTEDATTKVGMVKFTLLNTGSNFALIRQWLDASRTDAGVTIRLSDSDTTESFAGMKIITEPDLKTGSDGEAEVDFQGNPAQ